MNWLSPWVVAVLVLLAGGPARAEEAPPPPPREHPYLLPLLWARTAPEYPALCRQTYALALVKVREHLGEGGDLPPAVVVDLDETVLDNGPVGVEIVARDVDPDLKFRLFVGWVKRVAAMPGDQVPTVPGAREFLREVEALGVTVVYVTNRVKGDEKLPLGAWTVQALRNLGVDEGDLEERVLFQEGKETSKEPRREQVRKRYRVLAWVGDDLGDFLDLRGLDRGRRMERVQESASRWGEDWFVLPNPLYGNWLDVLPAGWAERREVLLESVPGP